jgi:formylglycine-generating enzyme required for sulfatase activity
MISLPALVRIPASSFLMGSDSGQDNERPAHRVWVDAFELGVAQVTNADYDEFVRAIRHASPPFRDQPAFGDPAQPVVGASWIDAVAYCDWWSERTGRRFRLPTEAEWECASRGGVEGALYPWGDDPPQSRPDYDKRWRDRPEPVARQKPNAFGLYDMCENVHEWCDDWYEASSYAVSAERNPRGPHAGTRRASRGGSWRHQIKISRCAARSSLPPHFHYADYGFRIACDIEGSDTFPHHAPSQHS